MAYGALLTDEQGVAFFVDGTRPLTLINKITINVPGASGVTSQVLYANDGAVRYVFVQSNSSNVYAAEWMEMVGGNWVLYTTGGSRTVTVYIFGYANQPVPAWGIAIWDASGNCILTNESKVLREVTSLGDVTNPNASGNNYSGTLGGNWAVACAFTGALNAVDNSTGQPRPIVINFYSSAYYNGSQTLISSHSNGSTAGTSSPVYTNMRNTLTAINVARY